MAEPKKAPTEPKTSKPEATPVAPKEETKKPATPTGPTTQAKKATAATAPETKKAATTKPPAKDEVKIVEKATEKKHAARAKPTLTAAQKDGLRLRRAIAGRRPRFRRQQWYEYKRLEDSGWRKPTGVDSAMRRHFGYEQSVVRIGFRGPADVRGLHPSGYQEVHVQTVTDLGKIDPKKQAARISRGLGARKLKIVYAEADKRGIRILNRRQLQ